MLDNTGNAAAKSPKVKHISQTDPSIASGEPGKEYTPIGVHCRS